MIQRKKRAKWTWTKEEDKKLRELWLTGTSLPKISEQLGKPVWIISSYAKKLSLARRRQPGPWKKYKKDCSPAVTRTEEILFPPNDCCQWPNGDTKKEGFHFCGKAIENKAGIYCDEHKEIARRKPSQPQSKYIKNLRATK